MLTGLHAPLSPSEEILLRRVAFESQGIDVKLLKRLADLALVDCTGRAIRLTALGRRRFDALPKAPLLATRGVRVGMIVEATLNKFAPPVEPDPVASAAEPASLAVAEPFYFDLGIWRERARRRLVLIRSNLIEHRKGQLALLNKGTERLAMSRALLRSSVPRLAVGLLHGGS